ncbi:hypothetical protein V2J09_015447 [Rumex salicifolius]
MEWLWTIIGIIGGAALLLCSSLLSIIFFEAYRRRFNKAHVEGEPIFENPNSLEPRAEKDKSFSYEVLIVDDGSSDGTNRVAFDFVKKHTVENVRVVLLGRNHGKGEAIRKIHAVAKEEFAFEKSASGSSSLRISDIPVAAFGSRAHLEEKALATRKWYRNFLMKGFHLVVVLAAGPGIRDTQCGFKMFTRAAGRKIFTNVRLKRKR